MSVSKEAKEELIKTGQSKRKIKSWFPVDKWDCDCQPIIIEIKKDPSKFKYVECPKVKSLKWKKYKVQCSNCGADIAELYAKDATLSEWYDLHYLCEHNKLKWSGCLAVNISPIDGRLGFECACGNDTRDFRSNTTLKSKDLVKKLEETEKGKDFGKVDSQFKVV